MKIPHGSGVGIVVYNFFIGKKRGSNFPFRIILYRELYISMYIFMYGYIPFNVYTHIRIFHRVFIFR